MSSVATINSVPFGPSDSMRDENRRAVTKALLALCVMLIREEWLDPALLAGMAVIGAHALAAAPPPKAYTSDMLLSPIEAAAVTGLAAKTLANYRSKGIGPVFIKTGSLIHYRYADLIAFNDGNKRTSTSDMGVDHD